MPTVHQAGSSHDRPNASGCGSTVRLCLQEHTPANSYHLGALLAASALSHHPGSWQHRGVDVFCRGCHQPPHISAVFTAREESSRQQGCAREDVPPSGLPFCSSRLGQDALVSSCPFYILWACWALVKDRGLCSACTDLFYHPHHMHYSLSIYGAQMIVGLPPSCLGPHRLVYIS